MQQIICRTNLADPEKTFSKHLTQIRNPKVAGALHEYFRTGNRSRCQGIHNIGIIPLYIITPDADDDAQSIKRKLKELETPWI